MAIAKLSALNANTISQFLSVSHKCIYFSFNIINSAVAWIFSYFDLWDENNLFVPHHVYFNFEALKFYVVVTLIVAGIFVFKRLYGESFWRKKFGCCFTLVLSFSFFNSYLDLKLNNYFWNLVVICVILLIDAIHILWSFSIDIIRKKTACFAAENLKLMTIWDITLLCCLT